MQSLCCLLVPCVELFCSFYGFALFFFSRKFLVKKSNYVGSVMQYGASATYLPGLNFENFKAQFENSFK